MSHLEPRTHRVPATCDEIAWERDVQRVSWIRNGGDATLYDGCSELDISSADVL